MILYRPKTVAYFIFSVVSALLLSACGANEPTHEEIVREHFEAHISDKLNDPESYEFMEIAVIDTVYYKDNIEYRQESFADRIEYAESQIVRSEESINERYLGEDLYSASQKEGFREDIKGYEEDISRYHNILEEIDSLEIVLGDRVHEAASYTYLIRFRASNAFGAKVINEYIIQTDPEPDFSIINITDEEDQVLLNPNQFPGYMEMIRKYMDS